ncbi:MAG: ABC transporter substrate-binding protein [Vicinamibacteria bacterium]
MKKLTSRTSGLLPVVLLLAALAGPQALVAAPLADPMALTATLGPRQGAWKRAFNPFRSDADTRWPASAGVYEPLLVYNRATATYLPWLATGYQWLDNNTKLRFAIRPGVLWSDATPFSARDVTFTFDLLRRFPALDRDGVWTFLASVAAVDASTVEFTLKRAYTPGLVYVGQQPIVSEHKWKDIAQPATFEDPSPVGTGPFTEIRRFEPTVYEIGRNPHYWQAGKPAVEVLRVPLYGSNDEIVKALVAGTLDWASLFLPDIEKGYVAKDPTHRQYWYPDVGPPVMLYLNTQRKPFDDRNVRKAVSMAIDRPRIMKEALNEYAVPADATGLAESQRRWKDMPVVQSATWTTRDLAQANRLLDAAGLSRGADGLRVVPGVGAMRYEIDVVQGWTDWVAAAGIIAQNLNEVGVGVTVKSLDYNGWGEALARGRFDLGLGFGGRGPTPYQLYRGQMDAAVVRPLGEKAVENFHRFSSEEASRLLRRFEASSDAKELQELGGQLQRLFVDNAPSLPLYASPLWGVFNTTRFAGFPGRLNPYAGAAPGGIDALPALVEVKAR